MLVTSGRGAVFRVLSLCDDTSDVSRESSLQARSPLFQCRRLWVKQPTEDRRVLVRVRCLVTAVSVMLVYSKETV